MILLNLLNLLNLFISPAVAAESVSSEISASVYLQAFLSLIFILGILFFATWVMRKVSGGKVFGNQKIKVIGGVALSPRERIVLLQIADECLVVGVVPGQIRTLHQLALDKIYSPAELAELSQQNNGKNDLEIKNLFQTLLNKKIKQ